MNIYFAGSITGGRDHAAIYPAIIALLRQHGTVHTEHVGRQTLSVTGETSLSARQIFSRDAQWVDTSDLVVAEVTTPSLGVGYELGRAEAKGIPVIALFDASSTRRLSAMVAGNPHHIVIRYTTPEGLLDSLHRALEQHRVLA